MNHDLVNIIKIKKRQKGESEQRWRECYVCGCIDTDHHLKCDSHVEKTLDKTIDSKIKTKFLDFFKEQMKEGDTDFLRIMRNILRDIATDKLVR